MTDRELLELAAKAAGINVQMLEAGDPYRMKESGAMVAWNPLTNDGDALRLAVSLGIIVETGRAWVSKYGPMYGEDVLPNPYAATRRAIVRAASEIGRNM